MMKTVDQTHALRQQIQQWHQQALKIAFVPTMGNLHAGHIALINQAKQHADKVVVSIFVNPMQFGANEDIANYPKTLLGDQQKLEAAGADLLFTPTPEIIYPKGLDKQTYIEVPEVSQGYCGESRPGHFRGVATVVGKLFNLVQPDLACFGLKDYQQVQVIQTMVEDLSMPIEILSVPTLREDSGLALSSRNGYLTAAEKTIAPNLYKNIRWLAQQLTQQHNKPGASDYDKLCQQASDKINQAGLTTDYIHVCHAKTLAPANAQDKQLVILAAAHCGKARLIDNIQFELN
jgi:pantoate--beta-alanine ligase